MAKILFVAFHGLVCVVDGGTKGFKAYVLRDKDNVHKQMFGDFLAEQDFKPATGGGFPVNLAFSSELQAGTGTLDKKLNPVVILPDFPAITANVIAVFTLPRPTKIHSRLSGIITPGMLVDPGQRLNPPPTRISAIRFFEYNFTDETKVFLSDDQGNVVWKCPPLATAGADDIAVFHVYDEPPQTLPTTASANTHNVQEFKDSMDFMGANVQIQTAAAVDPGSFSQLHTGILESEMAALDIRPKDFPEVIRRFRSGQSLGGAGGTQVCGGGNGAFQ